jgi:hypothetical protein
VVCILGGPGDVPDDVVDELGADRPVWLVRAGSATGAASVADELLALGPGPRSVLAVSAAAGLGVTLAGEWRRRGVPVELVALVDPRPPALDAATRLAQRLPGGAGRLATRAAATAARRLPGSRPPDGAWNGPAVAYITDGAGTPACLRALAPAAEVHVVRRSPERHDGALLSSAARDLGTRLA